MAQSSEIGLASVIHWPFHECDLEYVHAAKPARERGPNGAWDGEGEGLRGWDGEGANAYCAAQSEGAAVANDRYSSSVPAVYGGKVGAYGLWDGARKGAYGAWASHLSGRERLAIGCVRFCLSPSFGRGRRA